MNPRVFHGFVVLLGFEAIVHAEVPAWIRDLSAESADVRDAALSELPRRLLDGNAMRELLDASAADPEIESRGRFVCEQAPALAPALVVATRQSPDATIGRNWLESLLAAEIARRAPLDRLVARSNRSRLFSAGTVTGVSGLEESSVDLPRFLALLADHGDFERPVVLDPAIDASRLAAVTPLEMLPSTAGGLLKRLLVERDLRTVDLGLVHLVTTVEVEESIHVGRERREELTQRRRIEFDSARLLAARLLGNRPGEDAARFRLWRMLALAGSPAAARRLGAVDDLAIAALGSLAGGVDGVVGSDRTEFTRELGFEVTLARRALGRLAEATGDPARVADESFAAGIRFRRDAIGYGIARGVAPCAFLLGAATSDAPPPAAAIGAALVRLAAERIADCREAAIVAAIEVLSPGELVSAAPGAARRSEEELRALVSRAAVLHASGDEALAIAMFEELRGVDSVSKSAAALYEEIQAAQSAIERGGVKWVDRGLLRR